MNYGYGKYTFRFNALVLQTPREFFTFTVVEYNLSSAQARIPVSMPPGMGQIWNIYNPELIGFEVLTPVNPPMNTTLPGSLATNQVNTAGMSIEQTLLAIRDTLIRIRENQEKIKF